jgi:cytochrome c5
MVRILVLSLALGLVAGLVACGNTSPEPAVPVASASATSGPAIAPGADPADYEVFALRCSKCHSLARPLSSGIDDDNYWKAYVAKMRRQPGSGISADDSVAILRFLHQFSIELRRRKGKAIDPPAPIAPAAASSSMAAPSPSAGAPQ